MKVQCFAYFLTAFLKKENCGLGNNQGPHFEYTQDVINLFFFCLFL